MNIAMPLARLPILTLRNGCDSVKFHCEDESLRKARDEICIPRKEPAALIFAL